MDAESSSAPKLDVTEERKRALAAQATDGSLAGNAPSFGFNDGGEAIFEADQASYTRAQSVLHAAQPTHTRGRGQAREWRCDGWARVAVRNSALLATDPNDAPGGMTAREVLGERAIDGRRGRRETNDGHHSWGSR